ncbi:MAG: glycerol-3-phosphate dehydrogenase/oxidase [Bacteroidales bacterium]|nr:glycerol-3-phosphate dehydrogenase/oxidase [Bacteroidales bacterium]
MKRTIEQQSTGNFDVIIVGGGITGAALAYEAASAGLSVTLFEKADYGGATSSATSKLIHGGLRYLKNMELGLVRESLKERKTLSNIAPNFIYPVPFMIPTYKDSKSGKVVLGMGMVMYDILGFDKKLTNDPSKKIPNFRSLSKQETRSLESIVPTRNLTGSMIFYDHQNIFPERLTLAFLKSAEAKGAALSNYAEVTGFIKKGKKITGVEVKDKIQNSTASYSAPIIVNCTGPWADRTIKTAAHEETQHSIRRSEGIHIITRKLNANHTVSQVTKNERHIMIIPWRNHSLIGTTDKEYHGNPDDYRVTKESIMQLLNDVNENYAVKLSYEDVEFYYGGLRPLADTETENSYESSRKYEIYDNADEGLDGMITLEGGKYTTSRQLAENVMELIKKKMTKELPDSNTSNEFLSGCEIPDMDEFLEKLARDYPDFSQKTITYLGKNYGTESHELFQMAKENPKLAEVLNADGEILAEVVYAMEQESAMFLDDVLFRRTGLGTLGHPGKDVLEKIAHTMKDRLHWDRKTLQKQMEKAEQRFTLPQD